MKVVRRALIAVIAALLCAASALAQGPGSIKGRAIDSAGGVLQGAIVTLSPRGGSAVTNTQGEYSISGLTPGAYTVVVNYLGFTPFTTTVEVAAGAAETVNAILQVATQNEEVLVTGVRPRGEAEQINRQRTADNVVQVLSAEVIRSLPNANVADALGRLPSVTLERDEGEGKYVQIRGTEPRLSNMTIDGVNIRSPEGGVRQIKMDTLASDLVESVEINKTLQANMDGDGIGGSVNLRTKTAGEQPTLMMSGLGGFTPIIGGRGASEFDTTIGRRFGRERQFGALIGATYDWNGRGINDIEPSPTTSSLSPHYDSIDLRDYMYYRTRWGVSASTDYRLNPASSFSLRGFYSNFRNWGQKWVYSLNDGDVPSASIDWRRPDYGIGNLVGGGRHIIGTNTLSWDASASRSRMLQSGGNGGASFTWNDGDTNCVDDAAATIDPNTPMFSASCFAAGSTNAEDITNYKLSKWNPASVGKSAQLNLQGSASYDITYHAGERLGSLEFGGKIRNGHKYNDSFTTTYTAVKSATIPVLPFAGSFTDASYYGSAYPWPSQNVDFNQVESYVRAHTDQFTVTGGPGPNKSQFDLTERVAAGYVMNTVDFARARLVAGVRIESTHVDTTSFDSNTNLENFKAGGNYLDALPSASLRFSISDAENVRVVFSRAISRPDPQALAQAVGVADTTQNPPTVSLGNPNLKPEQASNFDLLFERYLAPLGVVQAGYFYKALSDPIIATQARPSTGPYAGFLVSQPGNAGSATLQGFEAAYQQHWAFLPGALAGLGLSANYSYTTSEARGLPLRTDHPALLRQAPHTWNISPTFDRGRVSGRVGLSYNGANIYAYQYQNLNSDATPIAPGDLTAGRTKGPGGDNYLYAHLQLDAQAVMRLANGLSMVVYGLNLNNEVFGFYNGSPQYVVQREFYKPTFGVGFRLTP